MKIMRIPIAIVLTCLVASSTVAGALLAPPIAFGDYEAGVQVQIDNTSGYKNDAAYFDIDRNIVSVYGSYGMFYLAAGLIDNSRMTPNDSGLIAQTGFVIGGGARMVVWQMGEMALTAYGQVLFSQESFDSLVITGEGEDMTTSTVSSDLKCTEILVGSALSYAQGNHAAYIGLDIVPYGDCDLEGTTVDLAEMVSLKIGGLFDAHGMLINVEVQLMANEGLRIGVGTTF